MFDYILLVMENIKVKKVIAFLYVVSVVEVFINVGTILGYISNYAFSKLHRNLGWHVMLGMGAISLVLLANGILTMPKSPRWLNMEASAWATRSASLPRPPTS